MHFTTIVALAFAALAAAAPSDSANNQGSIKAREPKVATFDKSEPDCDKLKDYCTHCNGDFDCETNPSCEWCYENDKFGH
ncbi:hypothetical protein F5Y09DRAFT_338225 [Xylaria sp. FL1042]|nr:hypothetical protein F5Y09DRAFT_338225 [Xylaria sp. FL1042]